MTLTLALIRRSGSITGRLLSAGVPMGPNVLLTVRGRRTGRPRTVPVAVATVDGRRWVVGAYGDVQWTRNLRAASEAYMQSGRRVERVTTRELTTDEAERFFGETLRTYFERQSPFWRFFTRLLLGTAAPEILSDPATAAMTRPVFEVQAQDR